MGADWQVGLLRLILARGRELLHALLGNFWTHFGGRGRPSNGMGRSTPVESAGCARLPLEGGYGL